MSHDYYTARQLMVETQVRTHDVTDAGVQAAMRAVPRENYCGAALHLAYADTEVEYAPGRWLMRPRDVAKLLQSVEPRVGERALAIGAPYAGAVLAQIGLAVDVSDGLDVGAGPYDVIICEGSAPQAPQAWLNALAPGGRLAVVERSGAAGSARLYLRTNEGVGVRTVFNAAPPILAGFEPTAAFAF